MRNARIPSRGQAAQGLSRLNRRILREFSRRTTEALRAALPLRLALPRLEQFLALNVAKEARKDELVIAGAADACASGSPPGREACLRLFEATRQIDRDFLSSVRAFPVGIIIRYEEIAPVRMERIERMLLAAFRICEAQRQQPRLRSALQASHTRDELERLLYDILRLYALETRVLSRSLRLPGLLARLRERIAQSLHGVMEQAARGLAADLAGSVHRVR